MTAAKKHPTTAGVTVAPGYVVINISGASGGVSYTREAVSSKVKRHAVATTFVNVMYVDHAALVDEINAAVKRVDGTILRNRCVKMSFGHFVTAQGVAALQHEVAVLRTHVEALNQAAAAVKSAHRGRVGVVVAQLDVTHPDVVAEVSRTVVEVLTGFRAALAAGDVDDVIDPRTGVVTARTAMKPLAIRAKNLGGVVESESAAVLRTALDRARTARAEVRERCGDVNLSTIDRAIAWFQAGCGGRV